MRCYVLAVMVLLPLRLVAQQRPIALPPAEARLDVEFSDLTMIRELRDGRVLLFDRKEERFSVVDFAANSLTDVARKGQGPGEFQFVGALLPLGADSSLAAETGRWLILDGDSVVATLPPDNPAIRAVSLWPLGADRQGRVLSRAFRRGGSMTDSTLLVLVDRATGRTDTIAGLRNGGRRAPVSTVTVPGQGSGIRVGRIPLNVSEFALLFPDGWTAVARLDPYRVDWRSPDGRWTLGRPVPIVETRMTDRERTAYAERNRWARSASDWPDRLPPFDTPTSMFASPDGFLVLKRLGSASEPEPRYDVIDRTGVRRSQLVLRPNEHIVGFGVKSVYVIETDDDGIQRLHRHPWPSQALRG
jgi:hypothetical protein